MPKKYILPTILILPLLVISAVYIYNNRSSPETLPPIPEDTLPVEKGGQNFQGESAGQYFNGDDVTPDISLVVNGEEVKNLSFDELSDIANSVPPESAVLEGQKYVSISELLKKLEITDYSIATISGYIGLSEGSLTYTPDELNNKENLPTLVNTYVPSWKLVRANADELPIGNPLDLSLRIVKKIEIETQ